MNFESHFWGMSRGLVAVRAFALVALAGTAACVTNPVQGDHIATKNTNVSITAYALSAGASIRMECAQHSTGFSLVTTFVAGTSPTTINGETVYLATASKKVPASCWEPWSSDYPFITYLRFKQQGDNGSWQIMRSFDDAGITCLGNNLANGPITAGQACGDPDGQILLVADAS